MAVAWGLHQLAKAISFLNNDCKLVHANIHPGAVVVDRSGAWKLFGFDCLVAADQEPSVVASRLGINCLPGLQKYRPPEYHRGVAVLAAGFLATPPCTWSFDSWGLGCIVYECFNGPLDRPESLQSTGSIPKTLLPVYRSLLHSDVKARLNSSRFVTEGRQPGGFLDNPFVTACVFLEELSIKEASEKTEFFRHLPEHIDTFPIAACRYLVLPQLLLALEYNIATSSVLASVMKIAQSLPATEYETQIVPCVVKLFASPDRAMRMHLLAHLDQYHEHLQAAVVNDQIFPHVANGFMDTSASLREATLKSMLLFTPKLTEKTINTQLLKFFAKLQLDEVATIRANTTICLGKVAPSLPAATRDKVLVAAFSRALKDTSPHSRIAGLMAFQATSEYYSGNELAMKILPNISPLLIDPEKAVRDQAFKTFQAALAKVEEFASTLPATDPTKAPEPGTGAASSAGNGAVGATPDAASWTGWAVSGVGSIAKKWIATPTSTPPATSSAGPSTGGPVTVNSGASTGRATGVGSGPTPAATNPQTFGAQQPSFASSTSSSSSSSTTMKAPVAEVSSGRPGMTLQRTAEEASGWGSAWDDEADEDVTSPPGPVFAFAPAASADSGALRGGSGWDNDTEDWGENRDALSVAFRKSGGACFPPISFETHHFFLPRVQLFDTGSFEDEPPAPVKPVQTAIPTASQQQAARVPALGAATLSSRLTPAAPQPTASAWSKFSSDSDDSSGWWSAPPAVGAPAPIQVQTSAAAPSSTSKSGVVIDAPRQSDNDGAKDSDEFHDASSYFGNEDPAARREAQRQRQEQLRKAREERKSAGTSAGGGLGAVKRAQDSKSA
ncbi:SCY1 protein kinase, variant 1 [Capsaspora owczarzaki ATCC 30864]|nr:SCY1 protein kinase, variant 1 [Capsaspora owczarzaki ATCC 30864]